MASPEVDPAVLAQAAPLVFEDDAGGGGGGAAAAAGAESGGKDEVESFDLHAGGTRNVTAGCVLRPGTERAPVNSYITFMKRMRAQEFEGDIPASWKVMDADKRQAFEREFARESLEFYWARAYEMRDGGLEVHGPDAKHWRAVDHAQREAARDAR